MFNKFKNKRQFAADLNCRVVASRSSALCVSLLVFFLLLFNCLSSAGAKGPAIGIGEHRTNRHLMRPTGETRARLWENIQRLPAAVLICICCRIRIRICFSMKFYLAHAAGRASLMIVLIAGQCDAADGRRK